MYWKDIPTVTDTLIQDVCLEPVATLIRGHAYRLNLAKRSVLKTEIDYVLEYNILEPSNSQWAFPVILIQNDDNSCGVC